MIKKTKSQSKLRVRSACDVVKGKSGPLQNAHIVKTEIEAFFTLH